MKRTRSFWNKFTGSGKAWATVVLTYLAVVAGCGGRTQSTPNLGSESHFLSHCDTSCNSDLSCISGLCTRACIVGEGSCQDLASEAQCTNQSVESGAVAVCDLGCVEDSECQDLDPAFVCSNGYCRARTFSSASNGTLVCEFSGPNAAKYEVCGEAEQCCTCGCGLPDDGCFREETCEAPQGIACGTKTCNTGDVCCAADLGLCGNSQAECEAAQPFTCELYQDRLGNFQATTTITNASDEPFYIQPFFYSCGAPTSLVEVQRGGRSQNYYGLGCGFACQEAPGASPTRRSNNSRGTSGIECPGANCVTPPLVEINPGQSLEFKHPQQEFVDRQLPTACVPGLLVDYLYCTALVVPEVSSDYQFTVKAFREIQCGVLAAGTECNCNADAEGICTGPGGLGFNADEPLTFTVEGNIRESHTLLLQAPQ